MEERLERLLTYCLKIRNDEGDKALYDAYRDDIETVKPQEVFRIMNEQLKLGTDSSQVIEYVDKLVNVFYKPLSAYKWQHPQEGEFLYYLMAENDGLRAVMDDMRVLLKERDYEKHQVQLLEGVESLSAYNAHMQKLENILFPYMEQKKNRFDGLKIMWALHDKARQDLKDLLAVMRDPEADEKDIYVAMGDVFFAYSGIAQKQELLMFPAATELFDENEFRKMHEQSFDYNFPYIEAPVLEAEYKTGSRLSEALDCRVIKTPTGNLTFDQVELLINTLPVDVTLVDENDKVAFFSRPKDRIFPRSAAIIGRDVRNCHPPESVHVVEEIVQAFKDGSKDNASFWIQMGGKFILIQYFALRDESNAYKGTLEVSQEISGIRNLTGEKRLLDWEK